VIKANSDYEEALMPRTVHFEIQASQPQALIDFYSTLFGWTMNTPTAKALGL
jgi:predicted enzyme related to lactoylglutathione lyase